VFVIGQEVNRIK